LEFQLLDGFTENILCQLREDCHYPFGEACLAASGILTDKLFTGQREMAGLGIYHYGARFYSPKLGRFLSADTIVPGYANPQNLNRYSYTINNPIRYIDPTGHRYIIDNDKSGNPILAPWQPSNNNNNNKKKNDDDGDGSGGNDSNEIVLNLDTRNICNYGDCDAAATFLGMAGTAADSAALLINGAFAAGADVAFVAGTAIGGPQTGIAAYFAMVGLYKLGSFIPNTIGTVGGLLWAVQGVTTGDTYFDYTVAYTSNLQLASTSVSASIAQDTVWAGLNDGLGWVIPDPNVATLWSLNGVVYDVLRNPLAPYFSSAPPIFPTVIEPHIDISLDYLSGSVSADFSILRSP
jgi:RHS repeat-associated protein